MHLILEWGLWKPIVDLHQNYFSTAALSVRLLYLFFLLEGKKKDIMYAHSKTQPYFLELSKM